MNSVNKGYIKAGSKGRGRETEREKEKEDRQKHRWTGCVDVCVYECMCVYTCVMRVCLIIVINHSINRLVNMYATLAELHCRCYVLPAVLD